MDETFNKMKALDENTEQRDIEATVSKKVIDVSLKKHIHDNRLFLRTCRLYF